MLKQIQWLLARERLVRLASPLIGPFNPWLPEHRRDPHATWRTLREERPVFYSRAFGAWFLSRYDDVMEVLRNPAFSADRRGTSLIKMVQYLNRNEPEMSTFMDRGLVMLEGPDHRRLRGLVSKAFTPRRVEALRPRLETIATQMLDQAAGRGELELVSEFAYPFPIHAIAELLGVPTQDREQLHNWTADLVQILDPLQGNEGAAPMRRATRGLFAYFKPLLEARRNQPEDDLLSAMIHVEEDGKRLDEGDLLSLCTLILAAGHETTANLIGNAVVALLRNPDERKRLQQDPSLMPTAVDEFLRYDSPIQFTDRAVVEDCEIAGQRLRKGQMVAVILASANRDPAHFENPDQLDLGRQPNAHLSLSHGTHFCLGAGLARLEAEVALTALLRRFPDFEGPRDPSDWRHSMMLRGPSALPLTL